MKKILILIITTSFLVACAGRKPQLVTVSQIGDNQKSCQALSNELQEIQTEIQKLAPQEDKTGKNVALGITGAFLIVPLFFMDFSDAEKQEAVAYQQRFVKLTNIATEKKCDFMMVTPDTTQSSSKTNTTNTSSPSQTKK